MESALYLSLGLFNDGVLVAGIVAWRRVSLVGPILCMGLFVGLVCSRGSREISLSWRRACSLGLRLSWL